MRDGKLSSEEATDTVREAVAAAAAAKSELPALLRDLSRRAEGRGGTVALPVGRSSAAPIHVVISDGYGGTMGGVANAKRSGGLVNFIFYSIAVLALGGAAWMMPGTSLTTR